METVNYNFEVQLRDDDGEFVKQAPVHPRDGLAGKVRGAYNDMATVNYNSDVQPTHEAVEFDKQVPVHPRDSLTHKVRNNKGNIEFIKQVLVYPRRQLKRKIKRDHINKVKKGFKMSLSL